jgi:hypothetical protein
MFSLRRSLRIALRVLAAVMVGGTLALGPRTFQSRAPQHAHVVLVLGALESEARR